MLNETIKYCKKNLTNSTFNFLLDNCIILDIHSLYFFVLTVDNLVFFRKSKFKDKAEKYNDKINALKDDADYIQSFTSSQLRISLPLPPQASILIFEEHLKNTKDCKIYTKIIIYFLVQLANKKVKPNDTNKIKEEELRNYEKYRDEIWKNIDNLDNFDTELKKYIPELINSSNEIYIPDISLATSNHYSSENSDTLHALMNQYKLHLDKKYKSDSNKEMLYTIKHELTYEIFIHLVDKHLIDLELDVLYTFISAVSDIHFFEKKFSDSTANYSRKISDLKKVADKIQKFSPEQIIIKLPILPKNRLWHMCSEFTSKNVHKDIQERFLAFFDSYEPKKYKDCIDSYSPNINLKIVPPTL